MRRDVMAQVIRVVQTLFRSAGRKRAESARPRRSTERTARSAPPPERIPSPGLGSGGSRGSAGSGGSGGSAGSGGSGERRPRRADPADRPTASPTGALPDTSLDEVQIMYSPCLDGDPDPGEVVWTWVPFEEDPSQGKDRPVVIIGRDGDMLAGVQLTSKRHPGRDDYVPVGTGDWDPQHRPSYAKLERVLTVDPNRVRREGAVLDKARFEAIIVALRREHE